MNLVAQWGQKSKKLCIKDDFVLQLIFTCSNSKGCWVFFEEMFSLLLQRFPSCCKVGGVSVLAHQF